MAKYTYCCNECSREHKSNGMKECSSEHCQNLISTGEYCSQHCRDVTVGVLADKAFVTDAEIKLLSGKVYE